MDYKDLARKFSLEGQTALITGAGRGIGRGLAMALAKAGANIVVVDIVEENAEKTAELLGAMGVKAYPYVADLSKPHRIKDYVKEILKSCGRIDILVNNAGMSTVGRSEELAENVWRRGIDVMLTGVFFCSQAAGNEMIKQKSGKIINIASINGIVAFPERACYCSAKAGVMALTKVLGSEWAQYNVNVNAIAPGYVETEMVRDLASHGNLNIRELVNRTPTKRLTECEDIANSVVFLASEDAKNITGQTIVIDGGWTSYGYLESWLKNR